MKNVLLLGGTGFIGKSIANQRPHWSWTSIGSTDLDLTDCRAVKAFAKKLNTFDTVINAAGFYGGLRFNQKYGREIFYQNSIINSNISRLVESVSPNKFINIGSACVYPSSADNPFVESQISCNDPHKSVIYSAKSKMHMLDMIKTIGVPWEFLIVSNVYGPGENLDYEKSHVVGGLISKLKKSDKFLDVIGTGTAVRDFIYINDMSEIVCRYVEKNTATSNISNVSSGSGTSIKNLVETLVRVSGKNITIKWGTPDQDGAPYKVLDNTKMINDINYKPGTLISEGLFRTWNWATDYKESLT